MTTRRPVRRLLLLGLCFGVLTLGMGRTANAQQTITVTNTGDSGAGSLRQAIADAQHGDTIRFGFVNQTCPCTIALTSGELVVDKDLTIVGPGVSVLAVSGGGVSRVFRLAQITARLQGFTIRQGNAAGASQSDGWGGGIFNRGALTLVDMAIIDNQAVGRGGGIFSVFGQLTVRSSYFSGNAAGLTGGAINADRLVMIASSVVANSAVHGGGGVTADSDNALIVSSTIAGNTGGRRAGGLLALAVSSRTVTVVNSTISGNTATSGGAIELASAENVHLIHTTVTGNVSNNGAIHVPYGDAVTLTNSIVVGNTPADTGHFDGPAGEITNRSSIVGGDARTILNPTLANNGGPTLTHALVLGGPAMNSGDPALVPTDIADLDGDGITDEALPFDQRGFARISGGRVDIGAVEVPPDLDNDGLPDATDNCPALANPDQRDTDGDATGDACDVDDDNDSVPDILDWFPTDPSESEDTDRDRIGNNADTDDDNDGVTDTQDAFPLDAGESMDTDHDGIGDNADVDDDGDGLADAADNCPLVANVDQTDYDHDGAGNACDETPGSPIDIVFVSTRDSVPRSLNLEIYGMRADGTGVVRLTTHPAVDLAPALSPDKSRIVFISTRDNNRTEIFVMNADGANAQRLTTNAAIDGAAAWSPDGTRLVFTSVRNGNADIYVMNADGSGAPTRLTTHAKMDANPAWGPGGRIAFASDRNGNFDIYTMEPDGTDVRRLTTHKADDALPTWSPDGTRLAFTSTRDGNAEIYVMNANGATQTRRTNHRAIDAEPAWGADDRILFTSTRGGNTKIYAMNPDGSAVTQLTNSPSGYDLSPHW